MKRSEELDYDDGDLDLDEQVDVEAFLSMVERQDRKRGKIAWREIERRQERRLLATDLDEGFYDD